ncbi:MAG: 2-oxoacid:acceptor oxidoreductase subunit alpha [Chloroflexi bacterium]|nr:2-oxoacid:acceptor oxidoreductase subunit alpha [Chloroflexota bacterium]
MSGSDLTVRVGGDSATGGIVTTGEVFARIAAYSGLEVYTTRTIPAEIKGGHVMFQARIAPDMVWSQGDDLDMLIAFDQESIDRYYPLVRAQGLLIYNSNESQPPAPNGVKQYPLPLNDLAKSINFQRGRNIITIGAMVKLFGLPFETAALVVEKQLGRKKDLLDQNLLALKTGYEYVEQNVTRTAPYQLSPRDGGQDQERLVLNGNQALSIGAIAAGCRFYAGYPITPASDIMEFLAGEFPKIGGTMIQAEDEMAAITMTLGASFTGVRSMTATSGPGLSLMTEMLGHATMAEIPIVVVDVQRAGPSTGMPTKVSQGDLRLSVFGAHDDAPRIVVAPVSVEDNFYQIINAFNLAEKYQTPVIYLSDQDMSVRVQTIPPFDLGRVKFVPRELWNPAGDGAGDFERFKETTSGVSPMSLPGMKGGQYVAEGLEHLPSGEPDYTPEMHSRNMFKRGKKIRGAAEVAEEWGMLERFGDLDAPVAICGWGSTIGPVREAVTQAQSEGMPVAVLYTKMIYPLPRKEIAEFIASRRAIIVPEMNYTGQFARMIQAEFWREVISVRKYGGVPFETREVYAEIKKAYEAIGKSEAKAAAPRRAAGKPAPGRVARRTATNGRKPAAKARKAAAKRRRM